MKYVFISITMIALFIASVVLYKRRQMERRKYYDAADRMVKEEYLEDVLGNNSAESYYPVIVPMLYINLYKPKPQQKYVFDPEKGVTIGRSKSENTIWLPKPTISMKHCSICVCEGRVYIQDEYSMNGTCVKKGRKKYQLMDGNRIELESGDRFYIDDVAFKVTIFYFQAMKRCR